MIPTFTGGRLSRSLLRNLQALVTRSVFVDTSRIAAFPRFANLPSAELDELAAAMREVEIEAGAEVVTHDDYGSAVYFIEQGEADARPDGGEESQGLGPGDTFGEIALLLTGQRTATVVARTPMRLLSLSGQDFDRIRARVPELEGSLRRLSLERAGQ
jgi:CRP/FNR family transcriptional regulator, cyclic AMP receptor protein